jgi:hypothetical protein
VSCPQLNYYILIKGMIFSEMHAISEIWLNCYNFLRRSMASAEIDFLTRYWLFLSPQNDKNRKVSAK